LRPERQLPGDPDAITEPDLVVLVSTKGF